MRIKKDPQLQPFLEYLLAELSRENTNMRGLDAPMIYRAQGRACCLFELSKLIENVDSISVLDKSNSGRPMTAGLY